MKFVILTGMSGAGKSTALKMMEDIGYFCVDNLPIALIEKFAELADMPSSKLQRVAVGIDIRSGQRLEGLQNVLDNLRKNGKEFEILYMDSTDEVLVKRYKETRNASTVWWRAGRQGDCLRAYPDGILKEAGRLYSGHQQYAYQRTENRTGEDFRTKSGL